MQNALCKSLLDHIDLFPMSVDFVKSIEHENNYEYSVKDAVIHDVLVDSIHQCCIHNIFELIYKPFSETTEFKTLSLNLENPEFVVTHKSFDYMSVIAQGSYGIVLECKKKTTKQLFAMKIQPKNVLLSHFRENKSRVLCELAANIVFTHPFIVGIAYAFQTETMVMLVSPISTCGDLYQSLQLCANEQMCVERVMFYAAEIISALMYLHSHDIMYRDLKPANILLFADGHIMLTDFGSLAGMYIHVYVCHKLFMCYLDVKHELMNAFNNNEEQKLNSFTNVELRYVCVC